MKVLVTGGAGFIGSHIVEHLTKDKKVTKIVILDHLEDGSIKNIKHLLKNKKILFKKADIRKKILIEKYFSKIDCVIHLAALSDVVPSIEQPTEYLNNNIMGTVNVLESMRKHSVKKIIYSASSSCYGLAKKMPTSETDKIETMYPYAFSKYIGELTIQHWSNVYGINYISLRLFNVYGTRSRTHGAYGAAIGVFLKQKLSNKPLTIVGNGKQKRDFVYVTDVARAFSKAIFSKNKNQVLNIASSKPRSVNELVKFISNKKVYIPKRPGEPDITFANTKQAQKKLKWKPEVLFKDGMRNILSNINYWQKAPLWNKTKIKRATKIWFKHLK
jgi:UDP-glucose 4-epimerase